MRSRLPALLWAFLTLLLGGCHPVPAVAQTPVVYPDVLPSAAPAVGALGENVLWQAGQSREWLAEEQAQAANNLLAAMGHYGNAGASAEALNACVPLDWMLPLQAANGQYPGTGQRGGAPGFSIIAGEDFHTTAIWEENVGKAVLNLKANLLDARFIAKWNASDRAALSAKAALYSTSLGRTASWLTTPAVASAGQALNAPYGHRRWYMAAGLAEASALNGGVSAYDAAAAAYAADGLSRVKGPGWKLALFPPHADGTTVPGTLVAPGGTPPVGYASLVPAEGVDPESFGGDGQPGADTGYEANNIRYAQDYAKVLPAGTLRTQVIACADAKALWVASRLCRAVKAGTDGTVEAVFHDTNGDSRHGQELDIHGVIKTDSLTSYQIMFRGQAKLTADPQKAAYFTALTNWFAAVAATSPVLASNNLPTLYGPATYGVVYPTPAPVPPAAPTGLTATAADTTCALSWTASTGATSYSVYRGTATGAETLLASGVTATVYADTGLTNGQAYFYRVTATNAAGEGGASAEATATPLPALVPLPPAPASLTLTASDGACALSWASAAGAASYTLYRGTAAGAEVAIATGLTSTVYTDAGLTDGAAYYYVVTAVNGNGESVRSPEVMGTPVAPTPPAMVRPPVPIIRLGQPWRGGALMDGRQQSYNPFSGRECPSRYGRAA